MRRMQHWCGTCEASYNGYGGYGMGAGTTVDVGTIETLSSGMGPEYGPEYRPELLQPAPSAVAWLIPAAIGALAVGALVFVLGGGKG